MNVIPFIRQHNTAKALYLNLVWLYGDEAGIDTQGGPPVPADTKYRNMQRTRASLLAALESDLSLGGETRVGTSPLSTVSAGPSHSALDHHKHAQPRRESALQPLPQQQAPPPPTIVRIYERTRVSPSPSLETIQEEPHPGRRISFGHPASKNSSGSGGCGASDDQPQGSISPLTLSEASGEHDADDEDLSPIEDFGMETLSKGTIAMAMASGTKGTASDDNKAGDRARSLSLFGSANSTTARAHVSDKASKKRDKFSFSFPLRRLTREGVEGKGRGGDQ